jgi:hypothetical protein
MIKMKIKKIRIRIQTIVLMLGCAAIVSGCAINKMPGRFVQIDCSDSSQQKGYVEFYTTNLHSGFGKSDLPTLIDIVGDRKKLVTLGYVGGGSHFQVCERLRVILAPGHQAFRCGGDFGHTNINVQTTAGVVIPIQVNSHWSSGAVLGFGVLGAASSYGFEIRIEEPKAAVTDDRDWISVPRP